MIRRLFVTAWLVLAAVSSPSVAAQTRYVLEPATSQVGFSVGFGPDRITGTFPVRSADIVLDFERPSNSRVAVSLDSARAVASFPFATQALRGPKVLATADFPTLDFSTTQLRADGRRARVGGQLTIRGRTRPVVLDAQIYRQPGSPEGDLSRLTVQLAGSISRSEFGAGGWPDMVGDRVDLDIRVRIRRAE